MARHSDEKPVEALLARGGLAKGIGEVDAREDVESVHGLHRHLVRWRCELLRIEVGHNEALPEAVPVAVEGQSVFTGVGGKESKVVEIILTKNGDAGLGRLDGSVEVVAPLLPCDLYRSRSTEGHLLRGANVAPLGYLRPPEDVLVLAAKLSVVFQSECGHFDIISVAVKLESGGRFIVRHCPTLGTNS